jgi:hypothetical protein
MQAIDTSRHEYPLSGWQRGFSLIFGLILAGIGAFGGYAAFAHTKNGAPVFLTIIPFALGIYLLVMALRSRLVIDGTRIEVRYAFTEKTADLNEIEGYRTISTRNGSFWQLKLKEGRGTISVQQSYDCDELRAWFKQLTDLDERDRNALLDQIEQNQKLGATPEDRLAKLDKAKQWNIGLSALAIAAALGFWLGGDALHVPSGVVLALLPAALFYLVHREPLFYAIMKPKRDPRTDLSIAFIACGLGLTFGNHGAHFVEILMMLEYAGLVALLCCAGIYMAARQNPQFWGAMIGMLFLAGAYGWGLAAAADTVLDRSTPASYTATVQDKHENHGRSTSYYLDLGPWGPIQRSNDVSVSHTIYNTAFIGEQVCLELHPGLLHVQWYRMVACEGSTVQ